MFEINYYKYCNQLLHTLQSITTYIAINYYKYIGKKCYKSGS